VKQKGPLTMTGLKTTSMTIAALREATVMGKSKTQKTHVQTATPLYGTARMKTIDH
jgi:hypothetical protein